VSSSRFIVLSVMVADEADDESHECISWLLVSSNNRPLGKAAATYPSSEACREDVHRLREQYGRVTSVATLFSAFSSPFLSGIFALGVFVVGRTIPDVRALAERAGGLPGRALAAACAVLPNLHLFYPSGAVIGGDFGGSLAGAVTASSAAMPVSVHGAFVGARYLGLATGYALGYSALVLGLAMLIFRRRDFV